MFSTPVIIALVFERFWQFRRRLSLWVVAIIAAAGNVLSIFFANSHGWNPPLLVWSTMTGLWVTAVLVVAGRFVFRIRSSG
jgi:hypothetical protein